MGQSKWPTQGDETLQDLLDFAGIVSIDEHDDWLEQWVKYSIVREKIRKATEHGRQEESAY